MEGPKWKWGYGGGGHSFWGSQNHGYRTALSHHAEASFQKPYELPESMQPFSLTVTHSQAATFCLGTESTTPEHTACYRTLTEHFSGIWSKEQSSPVT